jgi:hypothetical protein
MSSEKIHAGCCLDRLWRKRRHRDQPKVLQEDYKDL